MKKMGEPALKNDRVYTYGDYKIWPEDDVTTVVQPDISIICDKGKLAVDLGRVFAEA